MNEKTPAPELGSIVMFEHVNLRVPDHRFATLYFVEGLGLTRDPYRMVGTRNMWVNVGHQQFHLPIGEPTPLPGEVGVVAPDLDAVARQLDQVAPALKDSAFAVERSEEALLTTTPWGHRIRVHPQGKLPGRLPQALAYVEFWVPRGTSSGIGAFYREILQCPVDSEPVKGDPAVRVAVGPYQSFRFRERKGAKIAPNNNHVAVYLTRYRSIYAALEKRGLIMEEDENEQFRFGSITDPDSGALLYSFEHEMRSLHHPDYRRPLVNRVPVPYRAD